MTTRKIGRRRGTSEVKDLTESERFVPPLVPPNRKPSPSDCCGFGAVFNISGKTPHRQRQRMPALMPADDRVTKGPEKSRRDPPIAPAPSPKSPSPSIGRGPRQGIGGRLDNAGNDSLHAARGWSRPGAIGWSRQGAARLQSAIG